VAVCVDVPDASLRRQFIRLLQPLIVSYDALRDEKCYRLNIVLDSEGWQVYSQSSLVIGNMNSAMVPAAIASFLFREYYQSLPNNILFHGAAVHFAGRDWLIPGSSGAGKSTLVSALIDAGAYCYSDDALVLGEGFRPLPTHMPVVVKEGSWSLHGYKPSEENILQRLDGRKFVYRWLQDSELPQRSNLPPIVITPNFNQNNDFNSASVSLSSCIELFCETGYRSIQNSDQLIPDVVNFLSQISAYRLHYSHCDDVIAWMRQYDQTHLPRHKNSMHFATLSL